MKVELEVKTPIHIGDGGSLLPCEYIFNENTKKVYVYSFEEIVKILVEQNINFNFGEFKGNFLDSNGKLKNLKEILNDFGINFQESNFNGTITFGKKQIKPLYKVTTNLNSLNGKIWTTIKTLNKVYIPGSEIKGALRTAFLYYLIKHDNFSEKLKEIVEKVLKKEKINLSFENDNIQNMFLRNGTKHAYMDFFKFVSISDSHERKNAEEILNIAKVNVFNTKRYISDYAEVIKKDTIWTFDFELEKKKFQDLKEHIFKNGYKHIKEKLTPQNFLEKIKEFYMDLIDFEIWYWEEGYKKFNRNQNSLNSSEKVKGNILNFYKTFKQSLNNHIIPIRIGKYINRYSHVILLSIWVKVVGEKKEEDKKLLNLVEKEEYEKLLNLVIKAYKNPFSFKTRRYIDGENLPLGWAYIKLKR